MNLFETISEWKKIYSEFENELKINKPSSIFVLINDFIKFYYRKKNSPLLIVIDHYSSLYDKNNDINEIRQFCLNEKKFDIYIIYEINTIDDQKEFINYLSKRESVMNAISRKEDINNQVNLLLGNVACFIGYELRGISAINKNIAKQKRIEIEKNGKESELIFNIEKFMKNLPEDYTKYFGDNSYFYFKYVTLKNNHVINDFNEFVKNEKVNIKTDIINFIESNNSMIQIDIFSILKNIVNNENKELEKLENNSTFLFYTNSSYFLFHRIKNQNFIKYKYTYAFPLIKDIFNEIIEIYNTKYFINIRDPKFKELDGITMGICFDKFINNWIKTSIINCGFMEFSKDDIKSFNVHYLIKKNYKELTITEMCSKSFVENEIMTSDELTELKANSDKIKNKKCIILFQDINAKSIDICFLVKRNKDNDNYSINSFQMKCDDSFNINNKLLNTNRYEMTYLKNKFECLFNIKIIESYITYLSIFDIQKKCAKRNPDKFFFYNRDDDTFVDRSKKKIEKLPFYNSCKINFINLENNLEFIRTVISFICPNKKFSLNHIIEKEKILVNGNQINNSVIIDINQKRIKIYLFVKNKKQDFETINITKIESDTHYYIIQFFN